MYKLTTTRYFDRTYETLVKKNRLLEKKILKVFHFLKDDPFYPSLKSHKANTKNYGERWSSWVTEDLRIIWDFDEHNNLIILLLDIGKHSGVKKVYK